MVLVISSTQAKGAVYTNALRYFGIVAFQATPPKALSEISPAISAILITTPATIADPRDYVSKIKSYNKSVPVIAIADEGNAYDLLISPSESPSLVFETIQDYMRESGRRPLGVYKLAGLDVSIGQKIQCYCFLDIKFTATELFILRFLIRAFPVRQSVRDILKYAYPRSSQSMEGVVRTHISKINRKFYALTERYLITNVSGEGYVIDTPIKPEFYKHR